MPRIQELLDRLRAGELFLSDGAWGTELQKRGLPAGACPEEWNLSRPDQVLGLVRSYLEAGSQLVKTNSFGGTRYKLQRHGLAERVKEVNAAAAGLSRRAAGDAQAFVLASVGPTGEMLEPLGLATPEEMRSAFREQIEGLKEGGADAILAETFFALDEIQLVLEAARDAGMKCFATMTFDAGAFGFKTMMGVSIEQAAEALAGHGAAAVGANCGNGMENMIKIVKQLRPCTTLPILVHSNAGLPKLVGQQVVYEETPERMASKVKDLVAAGAQMVGGCCGTTPAHLAAFRRELDLLRKKK
jgi:5-methyltetrahydrofolate--homocysteine methyltransferase